MSVEVLRFYTLCTAMLGDGLSHAKKREMLKEMRGLVAFV
jgi:hypothetical protein